MWVLQRRTGQALACATGIMIYAGAPPANSPGGGCNEVFELEIAGCAARGRAAGGAVKIGFRDLGRGRCCVNVIPEPPVTTGSEPHRSQLRYQKTERGVLSGGGEGCYIIPKMPFRTSITVSEMQIPQLLDLADGLCQQLYPRVSFGQMTGNCYYWFASSQIHPPVASTSDSSLLAINSLCRIETAVMKRCSSSLFLVKC
ncbi:hypothetical protein EDC01DRAFT_218654 [Geopyxis carbonaria]|nr:hypothetical protein EDC01DRAFT_218654 [Geopyxis carbonaria]